MLTALVLGGLIAAGVHPVFVAIVTVGAYRPSWFLAGAAVWALWHRLAGRREPTDAEAAFLHSVAAELRGGAGIRPAIGRAALASPALGLGSVSRLVAVGAPPARIAGPLGDALPVNGRVTAAAFRLVADTGARAADVFSALADRSAEVAESARERHALSAQARLSAWIVGAGPLIVAGVMWLTGRFDGLGRTAMVIAATGLALQAVGAGFTWWLVRIADR